MAELFSVRNDEDSGESHQELLRGIKDSVLRAMRGGVSRQVLVLHLAKLATDICATLFESEGDWMEIAQESFRDSRKDFLTGMAKKLKTFPREA